MAAASFILSTLSNCMPFQIFVEFCTNPEKKPRLRAIGCWVFTMNHFVSRFSLSGNLAVPILEFAHSAGRIAQNVITDLVFPFNRI